MNSSEKTPELEAGGEPQEGTTGQENPGGKPPPVPGQVRKRTRRPEDIDRESDTAD